MKLLAIETTGPYASVAVSDEKREITEIRSEKKLSHLQSLIPMTEELLDKCRLQIGDLTHIAASEGPGSFTGIRIGLATARALAQSLDLPVIAVPTLQTFIWNMPEHDGLFCPIFDARREQVYAGAYYRDGDTCVKAVDDGAYALNDFLARIEAFDPEHAKKIMLFGDGLSVYGKAVADWSLAVRSTSPNGDPTVMEAPELHRFQTAASVAALACSLWEAGAAREFSELRPVYLRKAEAERKLEERLAKEKA
jgi:tRNA threonylcarbamoyladenosine biosynthesis protein TsaB